MKEKALLIGVNIGNQNDFEESMEELKNLAYACELNPAAMAVQNIKSINPAYCIGTGKVQELKSIIYQENIDLAIFNIELAVSQQRNLEEELNCKVIDRTYLILEIFSKRAKTREAKLQVETARLQYMLTRLIGANENMSRQRSGIGVRNRGTGETKLELERRRIEGKISELNKELEFVSSERQTQRSKRNSAGLPKVALVGYTNAGKSTLMNAMVERCNRSEDKMVFEKDMLFATLDTSVRNISLPGKKPFLLSDTVGFVSRLPHNLVKAFRSTLEEVCEANVLIHVVDYANKNYEQQMKVTDETLKEIGADHIPVIYAYNKTDLTEVSIPLVSGNRVYMSAKERIGMEELVQLIQTTAFADYIFCSMLIPYEQGSVAAYLNKHAGVRSVCYESNGTLLDLECRVEDYLRWKHFVCQK